MPRTPSALLWYLGVGLAETVPESSFWPNATTWIEEYFAQISHILKDEEVHCRLLMDDLRGLEKVLFPRLTTYIYARLKLVDTNHDVRTLEELLQQWASMDDITHVVRHEDVLKLLIACTSDPALTFSEQSLMINIHCLDLMCFAARVLIICSDIQRLESIIDNARQDAQCLVNILHTLLDYKHLKTAHPLILEVILSISQKIGLNSDLVLKDVARLHSSQGGTSQWAFVRTVHLSKLNITSLLPPIHPLPNLLKGRELSIDGNDIIIAVVGPSGTGKSLFINKLFGDEVACVAGGLQLCTQEVRAFGCLNPGRKDRKVIILDTPGFGCTKRTDYEILNEIVGWLESTYGEHTDIKLSGMLQFHSISNCRMPGAPVRNINMFRRLCGLEALKNVILLGTFWDKVESEPIGSAREELLKEQFWAPLIKEGSRIHRFDPPTYERAWEIVDMFLPATKVQDPITKISSRQSLDLTPKWFGNRRR